MKKENKMEKLKKRKRAREKRQRWRRREKKRMEKLGVGRAMAVDLGYPGVDPVMATHSPNKIADDWGELNKVALAMKEALLETPPVMPGQVDKVYGLTDEDVARAKVRIWARVLARIRKGRWGRLLKFFARAGRRGG